MDTDDEIRWDLSNVSNVTRTDYSESNLNVDFVEVKEITHNEFPKEKKQKNKKTVPEKEKKEEIIEVDEEKR